jgi:hypothetical protein
MLILVALLLATPAQAQSRGCIEQPRGPTTSLSVVVPIPEQGSRARAGLTLPDQPLYGSDCIAVMPPAADVLRGDPAPGGGLLRGDDGRANLLRDPVAPPAPGRR